LNNRDARLDPLRPLFPAVSRAMHNDMIFVFRCRCR